MLIAISIVAHLSLIYFAILFKSKANYWKLKYERELKPKKYLRRPIAVVLDQHQKVVAYGENKSIRMGEAAQLISYVQIKRGHPIVVKNFRRPESVNNVDQVNLP